MFEKFPWVGASVFVAPHAEVVAAINPSWDLLAGFGPGAVFGYVLDGDNATLRHRGRPHGMPAGSYFVINAGAGELTSPGGRVMLVHKPGSNFPFMVGGPIEATGRLRYINGCSDSLIIPPWRRGEPCLNHLHIPEDIEQTMHTHPSDRIGVVVRGRGQCVTPDGTYDLLPGNLWRIPADSLHRFRTGAKSLDIVAWHPDSDFGPTDDDHPMLRKTFVDGVSATELDAIRTR